MNTEDKELLHICPFCGSHKVKITSISKGSGQGSYYQGLCNKCFSRGPKTSNKDEAIRLWNSRVFGDFHTNWKVDNTQINNILENDEVALLCETQAEFNTLIDTLNSRGVECEVSKLWYLFGDNMDKTAVSVTYSDVTHKKHFGYCDVDYYKSNGYIVEKVKIIRE